MAVRRSYGRAASSGAIQAWKRLPRAEVNRLFAQLCLASHGPESSRPHPAWVSEPGCEPAPAELTRWVMSCSGEKAVSAVFHLTLPLVLLQETKGRIPAGWCEDEAGWLYGIVRRAVLGFLPEKRVPFAFYLARKISGNCSNRKRRKAFAETLRLPEPEGGTGDTAGAEFECARMMDLLEAELPDDDAGRSVRARIARWRDVAPMGADAVPEVKAMFAGEVEAVRKVIFSAR